MLPAGSPLGLVRYKSSQHSRVAASEGILSASGYEQGQAYLEANVSGG